MMAPVGAQTPLPLDKNGALYMVQQNGSSSQIYTLDRSQTPYKLTAFTGTAPGAPALNALGYNRKDGYMYVLRYPLSTEAGLYRIGKSSATGGTFPGEIQSLGALPNLTSGNHNAADVSPDGYFYFSNSSANSTTTTLRRINLNAGAPYTVTNISLVSASNPATAQPIYVGDIAFGNNGILYGVSQEGKYLYEISVSPTSTTATVNRRDMTGAPAGLTIGTLFFDGANELYGYSNAGGFYVIDIASASFGSVSSADPTSQSDGASVTDTPEVLDVIKSNGAFNQIDARTFEVPYVVGVKNTGQVTAANVQVNDNLRLTFGSGNPTISIIGSPKLTVTQASGITPTLNQGFNGDSDTRLFSGTDDYPTNAIVRVAFTVRLVYPSVADVPSSAQLNSAYVSSVAGTTYTNPGLQLHSRRHSRRAHQRPDGRGLVGGHFFPPHAQRRHSGRHRHHSAAGRFAGPRLRRHQLRRRRGSRL